jgi:small subunit ribosomal protein S17
MASMAGTSLSAAAASHLSLSSSMSGTKLAHSTSPVATPVPAGPLRIEAMKKIQGRVVCASSDKTVAVEVTRIAPHPRYLKRIKMAKKYHAHDPENECKVGDIVTLTKCKPVSKTKTFVVVERKVGRPRGERLPAPTLPPLESESEGESAVAA